MDIYDNFIAGLNKHEDLGVNMYDAMLRAFDGGDGSGNFGHEGRPGEVGGSGGGGGGEKKLSRAQQLAKEAMERRRAASATSSPKSSKSGGKEAGTLEKEYPNGTKAYTNAHLPMPNAEWQGEFIRMESIIKKAAAEKLGIKPANIDFDRKTGGITAWTNKQDKTTGGYIKEFYQTKPYYTEYQKKSDGKIFGLKTGYDFEFKGDKY